MMLPEYEGKALLRSVGIRVPDGLLIESSENVLGLLRDRRLNYPVGVKAQVESGGRGKAGGVLRADSEQQAVAAAAQLFRSQFNGVRPRAVLIEPWLTVERELYLSVIVDRAAGGYVVLFSAAGGMDRAGGAALQATPLAGPAQGNRANDHAGPQPGGHGAGAAQSAAGDEAAARRLH